MAQCSYHCWNLHTIICWQTACCQCNPSVRKFWNYILAPSLCTDCPAIETLVIVKQWNKIRWADCIQESTSLQFLEVYKHSVTPNRCQRLWKLIVPLVHWFVTRRVRPGLRSLLLVPYQSPTPTAVLESFSQWLFPSSTIFFPLFALKI